MTRRAGSFPGPLIRAPAFGVAVFVAPIVLAACCMLAVRIGLGFQFPIPWPDETGFISPAYNLATTASLFDAGMNPDRHVMWMPPGYMVVLACAFRLFGYGYGLVRWLSAACILACLVTTAGVAWRMLRGWRRAAMGWVLGGAFISPYVLIDGNIGRMEALFCALILLSLLAGLARRTYVMAAVVLLAATVHFNAVYFLPAPLFAFLARRPVWPGPGGAISLCVALGCLAAYGIYVLGHWGGFVADMAMQFQAKAFYGRNDPAHPVWIVLCGTALLSILVPGQKRPGLCPRPWKRGPAGDPIFSGRLIGLVGLEFIAMAHFGHEIWYDYGQPIGFALLTLGALCMPRLAAAAAAAVLTLAVGFRITPTMADLLPHPAMLTRGFVPRQDITRVRGFIATLHPGQTVDFGWSGMENFFLADLARSGARWTIIRHSVTQSLPFRPSDWRVACDSSELPASLRYFDISFQRHGVDSGCTILPGLHDAAH